MEIEIKADVPRKKRPFPHNDYHAKKIRVLQYKTSPYVGLVQGDAGGNIAHCILLRKERLDELIDALVAVKKRFANEQA